MASELQNIVDALGRRLKRAVAIDDARLRIQAYSSHYGTVDRVRLTSILEREAPDDSRRWVLSLGINEATAPMRLPKNTKLGMDPRVCAPIRYEGQLLGYLFLVDADESLTDDELVVVASSAEAAGVVMYRERLLSELERGRERELLRDLLSEDAGVRDHAAEELVEANLFVSGGPVAVLVVRPVHTADGQIDDRVRVAIGVALEAVRSGTSPRHGLQLIRPDHGLVVVATKDPALRSGGLTGLGDELRGALEKALRGSGRVALVSTARPKQGRSGSGGKKRPPDTPPEGVPAAGDGSDGWRVLVGIGEPHRSLADTALSYRQAQHAVRVATIVRSFGPVAQWSKLGIYRMLSHFPVEQLAGDALHPGLVKLFEHRDADPLILTLEHYLDRGCDAKATAAELELHRASLYYRLHKIEEIAGASLRDGEDRLALHLGLKIARLAGIHPLQRQA